MSAIEFLDKHFIGVCVVIVCSVYFICSAVESLGKK